MEVKNLLTDANETYRQQISETRALVNKWNSTGLLEGINKEYDQHGMAVLLENQARQLIQEASRTGGQNSEEWSGVALPLVRRVFAEISAKDFVSVQPMNLPSGLVFYLDFKYGTTQNGFTSGTDVMGNTSSSSVPTGGLYGPGKQAYSSKKQGYTAASTNPTVTTASWADVNYDSDLSASIATGLAGDVGLKKVVLNSAKSDFDADIDFLGARAFQISGSTITIHQFYPAFTVGDASANTVTFIVSASAHSATAANYHLEYQLNPSTAYDRGDFEQTSAGFSANPETDLAIPEINVELRSEAIIAKTKKLKAAWSPEFAQDLNAYHSIDAEAELTSMLSEYISMEIDLEILEMLMEDALHSDVWSARIAKRYNGGTAGTEADFSAEDAPLGGSALAYTQNSWFQTLGTKVQKLSNRIHTSTMRGGANFLVASPDVCTILESIPGYAADTDGNKFEFAMGVQKAGLLNSRFQVYKNPYMQENTILMGFRGSQFLETGAVYAPYVPLIMTPLVLDPKNFTPRKGVMTRYAKKMVRKEFFGKIYVNDLNLV